MGIFEKLQHIDRRVMYVLLALVLAAPLIWVWGQPIEVSPAVRKAYDTIEKMPSDKVAIIVIYWGSGTIAENRPQTEAIMRHLFELNKKFAILAFSPEGSTFALDSAKTLAAQMGKKYGTDWVHLGYKPPANLVPLVQSFPRNVNRALVADKDGTPLSKIPMMRGVKDIHDIGLIADTTSVGELDVWIAYVYGPYRTPIVYAPTAVIAPEAFNPLDAGQIKGLLPGLQGAAAYERLLGRAGFATKAMGALSTSHILIILLIIAGNVGYISSLRRRRREGETGPGG